MILTIIIIISLWRIGLFAVAAFTGAHFPFTPSFPYSQSLIVSGLPQWLWAWGNFDGVHYLTIIERGYFAQFTQVFFPLFPLIVRHVGQAISDKYFILSALAVNFISLLLGLIIFAKLLKFDYKENITKVALISFLLFPTSFYFAAIYTEAIFFLFTVLAFWCARRRKWVLSGICGLLASAIRLTGIFLLPALLWEWQLSKFKVQSSKVKVKAQSSKQEVNIFNISHLTSHILRSPILYLVPLGLISYMVYLQIAFGDALYFWHAQSVFGAARLGSGFVTPFQVMWRYMKILTSVSPQYYHYWTAVWEFVAFIFAVVMLLFAHRQKVRLSYLIFSWLVVLVPTFTGTFSSMPRYISLAFPIYIVVGNIRNSFVRTVILLIWSGLLVLFTSNFIRGLWVA